MKMNTLAIVSLVCSSTILLSACSMNTTHDSTSIKRIYEVKLANGHTSRIGFTPADASWNCREIDKMSSSTGKNNLIGNFKMGGSLQALEEHAIEYANQKHLKPNYIFLYTPSQTSIEGFDLNWDDATATFYHCKNPPSISNKIF